MVIFNGKRYEILVSENRVSACGLCVFKNECSSGLGCNLVPGCYFKECKNENI